MKVQCWVRNKVTNEKRSMIGYSGWLIAKERYHIQIDEHQSQLIILDNAVRQNVTVILKKIRATLRMQIKAEFLYELVGQNLEHSEKRNKVPESERIVLSVVYGEPHITIA